MTDHIWTIGELVEAALDSVVSELVGRNVAVHGNRRRGDIAEMTYAFMFGGFLLGATMMVGVPIVAGIYGWGFYVPLLWALALGLHQTFWTERAWIINRLFEPRKLRLFRTILFMIFGTALSCCLVTVPAYLVAAWLWGHL